MTKSVARPFTLSPWIVEAQRELIDHLDALNNGLYETPADLAEHLEVAAESMRLVLDPNEFEDDLPEMIRSIVALYIALQLAANEAVLSVYPQATHAETVDRWLRAGLETAIATPGDQQRDLVVGTLGRVRQLLAEVVGPQRIDAVELPPAQLWQVPQDDIITAADLELPDYVL